MVETTVVNEKYVAEYYAKTKKLNELKRETRIMSDNIKEALREGRTPLGKTYGKYTARLIKVKKLNANFIQLLRDLNMSHKIVEIAYIKDCKDIIETFTKEDEEKYYDDWYKQLKVEKIN